MFELNEKLFCVIGDPVGHSLSPTIHAVVFREIQVDFQYTKVHVKPNLLDEFIREVRLTGCPGFNATMPHKETVIQFLDEIDPSAEHIGAVNTVHQTGGRLKGYNTDVTGLMYALKREGWNGGDTVLLLGAGGAARAAIEAMGLMHVSELILYDLIDERAQKLATDFMRHHPMNIVPSSDRKLLADTIRRADLIINATPVGMWPNTDLSPVSDPSLIPSSSVIFDMVYKPLKTRLIQDAETRGTQTISGLGMLVAQALAADELWLDTKLPGDMFDKVWEVVTSSY